MSRRVAAASLRSVPFELTPTSGAIEIDPTPTAAAGGGGGGGVGANASERFDALLGSQRSYGSTRRPLTQVFSSPASVTSRRPRRAAASMDVDLEDDGFATQPTQNTKQKATKDIPPPATRKLFPSATPELAEGESNSPAPKATRGKKGKGKKGKGPATKKKTRRKTTTAGDTAVDEDDGAFSNAVPVRHARSKPSSASSAGHPAAASSDDLIDLTGSTFLSQSSLDASGIERRMLHAASLASANERTNLHRMKELEHTIEQLRQENSKYQKQITTIMEKTHGYVEMIHSLKSDIKIANEQVRARGTPHPNTTTRHPARRYPKLSYICLYPLHPLLVCM